MGANKSFFKTGIFREAMKFGQVVFQAQLIIQTPRLNTNASIMHNLFRSPSPRSLGIIPMCGI